MKPKIRSDSANARLRAILTGKWFICSATFGLAWAIALLYSSAEPKVTTSAESTKLATSRQNASNEDAPATRVPGNIPTIVKASQHAVCGVPWDDSTVVILSDLDKWHRARLGASEIARNALVDTLLSRASLKERAAGLFLKATTGFAACSGHECRSIAENHNLEEEESVRQLAELGRLTESPEIYAWAQSACYLAANSPSGQPSACSNLSNLRLAELAPNNVWPWLALARAAGRDGDLSGQQAALLHASQATDWRNQNAGLASVILGNIPAEVVGLPRADLLAELTGRQGSNDTGLGAVAAFCGHDPDANKTQICASLVEHILQDPEDLNQLSLGIRIAKRAALQGANLPKAEADLDLMNSKLLQRQSKSDEAGQSCVAISEQINYLESIAKIGVVRTLRTN